MTDYGKIGSSRRRYISTPAVGAYKLPAKTSAHGKAARRAKKRLRSIACGAFFIALFALMGAIEGGVLSMTAGVSLCAVFGFFALMASRL